MSWLQEVSELSNSLSIYDRLKAIEIFSTNTKLQEKKGSCDNCAWASSDNVICNNPNYKDCNIFTNSLFLDVDSDLRQLLQTCYNYIKTQKESDYKSSLIESLNKCCFD